MHPILAQRKRLALYLASWVPVVGLIATLLVLSGRLPWVEALVLAIPMGLLNAFLCLSAWYLCRTFPLRQTSVLHLLAICAIASLFTSSFWVFIGKGLAAVLAVAPQLGDLNARYAQQAPLLFAVGLLLFMLVAAIHYLLSSFESSRESERRALQLQILAREAELKSLRAQIDPHFLFNCLNSISALTALDPAKARQMCLLLADFLRMSLDLGSRDAITLEEEVALASQFLAVEQVRLGPRLVIDQKIQESSKTCMIPPLLLQPLVENAVRHGVAQLVAGGPIRLEAERRGERLKIAVENEYDPDASAGGGKGIGLKNVRRRLATSFGTEARMDLQRSTNVFRVEISFPAIMKETGGGGTCQ
jgi:two-component system sensor histidine kinase AlgZ